MKKRVFLIIFCAVYLSSNLIFPDTRVESIKDLPEKYQKWLNEEVVYIITPKEKEVFLKLENDRERELFIDAFWKQRDPNPNTPENEFKKEHFRRIAYANQWFGRDTPGAGWKSPMGMIYIILGEPNSIDRFENVTEVHPVIIWFYQGKEDLGLPDSFNVVFFKRDVPGDWTLYSPIKYGPQELISFTAIDANDTLGAFKELMAIEPTIASISLSLIPGESLAEGALSMASEVLISQKIPAAPREKVKDSYADKFYKYKDSIGVEYSANYIENDFAVDIIQDKSGISFVHYLIEPKKLSLQNENGRYFTELQMNILVSEKDGTPVYQAEKNIPIEFSEDQVDKIKNKLFSFQDLFPLIEGTYNMSLLLKNAVSKEFTSAETKISVPSPSSFQTGPLVLANRISRNSENAEKNKPFLIQGVQLVPSPRNDFTASDTLYLFFQIQGLTDELKADGSLQFTIADEQKTVFSTVKPIKAYASAPNFFEEISLAGYSPALYKINVALLGPRKEEMLSQQADFFVSYVKALPRPFIMSLPLPPSNDPLYDNILGNQYLNKKNYSEARARLGRAYRAAPDSAVYARDYCKALFSLKDFQAIKDIAEPFYKDKKNYEFAGLLGQAAQALGEFGAAIDYYHDYLAHLGMNIHVLNAIGECYAQLGESEEALKTWEKSLQISPKQESLRNQVEALRKKK